MKTELTCDLDYKAEYERLVAERHKMQSEIAYLRTELEERETEAHRMRAQLDMVYLIFGGRNHG